MNLICPGAEKYRVVQQWYHAKLYFTIALNFPSVHRYLCPQRLSCNCTLRCQQNCSKGVVLRFLVRTGNRVNELYIFIASTSIMTLPLVEFPAVFSPPWTTFHTTGCTLRRWWSRWSRWRPCMCLHSIILFIVAQGGFESRPCKPPKLTWRQTSLNGSKTPSKVVRTLRTLRYRPSVPYKNGNKFVSFSGTVSFLLVIYLWQW